MISEYKYFGVASMPTNAKQEQANKLGDHLRRAADYIEDNCEGISNFELSHAESYSNMLTKLLWDHEERKTVVNHNGKS
jgi:hypothetical protein